jgi:pyruvate dehydrogenase E1 component beta subunit
VTPTNPVDAYHLIRQAIACDDPVIFLEPKRRYWDKADVDLAGAAPLPMSAARVAKAGRDLTLVSYGPLVRTCLEAAAAAEPEGVDIEVVDLRSVSPIDVDTVTQSVRRTGRCVVVHEASTFLGVSAEVSAVVTEECFYDLESPVLRVGGFHTPYPPSRLESHYLPDLDRILDAVDRAMAF